MDARAKLLMRLDRLPLALKDPEQLWVAVAQLVAMQPDRSAPLHQTFGDFVWGVFSEPEREDATM